MLDTASLSSPTHEGVTSPTLSPSSPTRQINQVAKQHKINLIFAVTREQSSVYSRLAQMVEGSSQGELTADSSNVVELVKEEYGVRGM